MPTLQLAPKQLRTLADAYDYGIDDSNVLAIVDAVSERGCLTLNELTTVGKWKSPRSAGRIGRNSDAFVRNVTQLSLAAGDEMTRVIPLTALHGVGWPTASVILHFFHPEKYPILDFRALFSVEMEVPNVYSFDFWMEYVSFTRDLSTKYSMSMRDLDKALWQYSKAEQGKSA